MTAPAVALPVPVDDGTVRAAGALLWRGHGKKLEVAVVHRPKYDDWSWAKGKLDTGEEWPVAAVREVAEETGIIGEVVAPLGIIDFWFVAEGRRVHKTVHHFLLRAIGGALSDADIEVTEVAWVPLSELSGRLAYADERALVERAPALLADTA